MRLWICEKPSQAKDIAAVLGATGRGEGFIETRQGRVTWAIGHLLEQAPPDYYDAAFKDWSVTLLPIVPKTWALLPVKARAGQVKAVGACIRAATEVVVATDADREGESIARELLDHFKYRGPIKRLWLRALDTESIKKALEKLKDGAETLPLHWAAQARARADWLVGMNLTRAATKLAEATGAERGVRSVGRVQTPTLNLVVRRDREIEGFRSRDFYELSARMETDANTMVMLRFAPSTSPEDHRVYDRAKANALAEQASDARGPLRVTTSRKRQGPPKLFSLSELQKACNRRFGWSADKTLSVAQELYETHKLTSYPRTDCSYVPVEQKAAAPSILASLRGVPDLGVHAVHAGEAPVYRASVFDTSKITAHHAIIPTGLTPRTAALPEDARKAFFLIAQRYVAAMLPDHEYDETRIAFDANGVPFSAKGQVARVAGWKAAFGHDVSDLGDDADADAVALPAIADGEQATAKAVDVEGRKTQPPKPYTEGTLIEDMKSVAKFATDPVVKSRLKETSGIGTEATRASIIKTLRDRLFIEPKGKTIRSTTAGRELIDALPDNICDAALTAVWEDKLDDLASGKVPESARDTFATYIEGFVGALVSDIKARIPEGAALAFAGNGSATARSWPQRAPSAKQLDLARDLADRAGLKALPAAVSTSSAECSAFIEQYMPSDQAKSDTPSASQLQQLDRIERDRGTVAPHEARESRKACSEFLDTVFGKRAPSPGRRFSR